MERVVKVYRFAMTLYISSNMTIQNSLNGLYESETRHVSDRLMALDIHLSQFDCHCLAVKMPVGFFD
jgi:hypothetical protein